MKITQCLLSAFCALSTFVAFASEAPEQQPSTRSLLNKYVQVKPFLLDVASFFAKDTDENIEKKDLLRLVLYVNFKKLPELFSLEQGSFEKYLSEDSIKEYVRYCLDESSDDSCKKKAKLLKKCFRFKELDTLLGHPQSDVLLGTVIDLFHFKGKPEKKTALLTQLKDSLKVFQVSDQPYIDIQELNAIIDDFLADKSVAPERIARTINCSAVLSLNEQTALIDKYTVADKVLCLVFTLLSQDTSIPLSSIINLLRWDTLVELIGEQYCPDFVKGFINFEGLKQFVHCYQQNKPLNKGIILNCFNLENLYSMGVTQDAICSFIDMDEVIASLQTGGVATVTKAVDVPKLEQKLGIDVSNALDTTIPESVQLYKLFELYEHITNAEWFPTLKYWSQFIGAQLSLWTVGHYALFTQGIKSKLVGMPILALILYLTHKSNRYFSEPITERTMLINTMILKSLQLFSFIKKKATKVEQLMPHIPDDHPMAGPFREFFALLTDQHVALLDNPYHALELVFDNPLKFIALDKYRPFIEGLVTIDKDRAKERMGKLFILLDGFCQLAEIELPYEQTFKQFFNSLNAQMTKNLTHEAILFAAHFCPALLLSSSQSEFIRSLGQGQLKLLLDAVAQSKMIRFE